jgi:uncharacterized membrane protein YvlD (DUF360 family)
MPGYASLQLVRNASVRTGIYVGACLSVAFIGWVIIANRVPFLEPFAFLQYIAAVAVLCVIAMIPVLRFWRMPGNLLGSGLVAWFIFSVAYWLLSLYFSSLEERYSAVQVFILGAVAYLLVVTISWIGTIIRRARASDVRPNHPVS